MMNTKISLRGADGLRALACLMVMAHHAFQRLNLPAQPEWFQPLQYWFLQGNSGVSVFFVLSGFLLATPFWSAWLAGDRLPSLIDYGSRRAARIMPGYYLNLLLTFGISLTFISGIYEPWARLVGGLTFTAGFNWKSFFPVEINGPLWSISFEVFSYLLLPIFMLGLFWLPPFRKRRHPALGLGWWLGVLVLVIGVNELVNAAFVTDENMKGWQYGMVGGAKYWMPRYNPWGFFGHYSLGVIAAGVNLVWQQGRAKSRVRLETAGVSGQARVAPLQDQGTWLADALALIGLAGMAILLFVQRQAPEFSGSIGNQPYYFPWFPGFAALILASLPQSRLSWRVWDNPVCRVVARISFGLYIWHYFVMEIIAMVWQPGYRYFGVSDPLAWAGITGLAFAIAIILATVSWYFLEKPILDRVRGRAKTTR